MVDGPIQAGGSEAGGGSRTGRDGALRVRVAENDLTVYVEWPQLRDALLNDIQSATKRIWIEVYIFANDAGGRRIAEALQAKARAGVEVRVLYDAIGSQATPNAFFGEMRAAGVQVHGYHSLGEAFTKGALSLMNRRDHRKLLVIDERVGYFGGMNLTDNAPPTRPAPRHAGSMPGAGAAEGWRDLHVRLEGSQATELAESFERSWRRARGEKVLRRPRAYRRGLIPGRDAEGDAIRFFDSGPGGKYSRAARVFVRLLLGAQNSIIISMAYFIPVGRPLRALLAARRRGVRVRVIVPGKSDVPIVQHATAFLYAKLLRRGFKLYERRDRMLHGKVIVIDGQWTAVGSCNFDPRSLYINLEFVAVIRSDAFAEVITSVCRFEMQNSARVTVAAVHAERWPARLRNRLAWALRWLL